MNPLALLKLYARANPEKVQRMATILIFLLFSAGLFLSGYWIGKLKAESKCERTLSEERIAALESVTETYALLMGLEKKHAEDAARLEQGLGKLDRAITRSVNTILSANPELARWYREPINDLQRRVMYADVDSLLREAAQGGLPGHPDNAATGNRVAHP